MAEDIIFISHANPQDNEFTHWLALSLVQAGFRVWTDITGLVGGEDFWREAESCIRNGTIKFLYVLSRTSNSKDGPLQELQIAKTVARNKKFVDFVIPLAIDDIAHADINIQLTRLNVIPFQNAWASGLSQLLDKLHKDEVPTDASLSPGYVARWWKERRGAVQSVARTFELCSTNFFPVLRRPERLHYYYISDRPFDIDLKLAGLSFPAIMHKDTVVTFADPHDVQSALGLTEGSFDTKTLPFPDFDSPKGRTLTNRERDIRNHAIQLLNLVWPVFLRTRQLPRHEYSQRAMCFYFTKDLVPRDSQSFVRPDGSRSWRGVVGYKSMQSTNRGSRRRWWHFGVSFSPRLTPAFGYIVRPHVLFSDDGTTIWESTERLHSARRSQCKDWWNDDWRDRIFAAVSFLSPGAKSIHLPIGENSHIEVSRTPLILTSPVSYTGPVSRDDALIVALDEEDDLEDDPPTLESADAQ